MLAAEPDDPFCLYSLALEYAKAGDAATAIAHFDRTIEVDPDYCYAYYHKARVLEENDDLDGAVETLRIGLERAKAIGDQQAISETEAFLDSLT